MVEKTELIIKGNKLVQRKTLDLPLEDSESIFKQFIENRQMLTYTPLSTDYFHRHKPDLVKRSWLLSKDFNDDYGAVHQVNYFPLVDVWGRKLNNPEITPSENRMHWFNQQELEDYEACSVHYLTGGGYDTNTEYLIKLKETLGDDLVTFPNNTVRWSDPRFDLFLANFTPENDKVHFFAIEKEVIEFEGRKDNEMSRLPLNVALPNVYESSQICMGREYDDKAAEYSAEDKQKYILHMFSTTGTNRDLDVSGTYANLTFNVRGRPIPLHNNSMFRAPTFSNTFDYGCPFRSISDSFILNFTQQYTDTYGLEHS